MPPIQASETLKSPDGPSVATKSPAPAALTALPVEQMYRRSDLSKLSFQTTDDLEPVDRIVGQTRAVNAIDFATRIHQPGFNLFVVGSDGARTRGAVQSLLKSRIAEKSELLDWVYVNNFADPHVEPGWSEENSGDGLKGNPVARQRC